MQENETIMPAEEPVQEVNPLHVVAEKIAGAQNILVALSADPSVDELAAAIGLSIYLDKAGKHVVSIYSGATPNALEFLNPEETFEDSADVLQDFVIAINKEKADHLRYKVDGDYVKIFITPYRSRIAEDDLEYSYGDYNVDLVLALDVANGVDLDAALREHGRIMHDATIVNITTGNPGKLAEIEWSDKTASSVSEMLANLAYTSGGKVEVGKEEATAFLTGIVAATDRFSAANTTPMTMNIASKLMQSGANQQLVAKNITADVDNEMFGLDATRHHKDTDPTNLEISHNDESDDGEEVETDVADEDSSLLADLKAAEANLAAAGAEIVPEEKAQPLTIKDNQEIREERQDEATAESVEPTQDIETPTSVVEDHVENDGHTEKVVQPLNNFTGESLAEGTNKYGQMLTDALDGVDSGMNFAAVSAPVVPNAPEINGVPEMNYAPVSEDGILPPPPAPAVNMDAGQMTMPPAAPVIKHAEPVLEPAPEPLGSQPAMQDQVYNPPANNPGAFQIPGNS